MPTITADQVRVPADVMPESREIYVENYMKATRGTGRLMLFACDQKVEHMNGDFYGEGIDIADAEPEHLFRIGSQGVIGVLAGQRGLIAQYAASLVDEGDSIYLDSGTTTYEMIKYLKGKEIVVVTNGLSHVESLIEYNIPCFVLGGKVKQKTKAVVGYEAISALHRYRFDKCFMGSNGVHSLHGFTTPYPEEAMIKENAIKASNDIFILVDDSKFGEVSFTRFAEIGEATIITNSDDDLTQYQDKTTVKVVRK